MRSRILFITALLLSLLLVWAPTPASALSGLPVISFSVTCDHFAVTHGDGLYNRDNSGLGGETITRYIVDGDGNIIFLLQSTSPVGNPIFAATTFHGYLMPPTSNPIHLVVYSNAGNGLLDEVIWDLTGDCPTLPPSNPLPPVPPTVPNTASAFAGVGIPAGFIMHTISCTTPVYTDPAGVPVGEDRVLAGQTWYVDPAPVEGADGRQWTEIFVGSAINPWIPTECVGGVAPLTPA